MMTRHEFMIEATAIFVQGHLEGIHYTRGEAIELAAVSLGYHIKLDEESLPDEDVEDFLGYLGLATSVFSNARART